MKYKHKWHQQPFAVESREKCKHFLFVFSASTSPPPPHVSGVELCLRPLRRRQSLNIDHTSTALLLTGQTDSAAAIFGLLYHISSGDLFFFFLSFAQLLS